MTKRDYDLIPDEDIYNIFFNSKEKDIFIRQKDKARNELQKHRDIYYEKYKNLSVKDKKIYHAWCDKYIVFDDSYVAPPPPTSREKFFDRLTLSWLLIPFVGSLPIFVWVYPTFISWVETAKPDYEVPFLVMLLAGLVYGYYHLSILIGAHFKKHMENN